MGAADYATEDGNARLARLARSAVELVAPDIAQHFGADIGVEAKTSVFDPVTELDRRSERRIAELLQAEAPGTTLVGEEYGVRSVDADRVRWHIDPIDGTMNYVSGFPYFGVSLGVELDGRLVAGAVCDPMRRETFWAGSGQAWVNDEPLPHVSEDAGTPGVNTMWPYYGEPGDPAAQANLVRLLRSYGVVRANRSFALQLAHVAAGRASVAVELDCADSWDIAGGIALAQAVGCTVHALGPNTKRPTPGAGLWASASYVVARDVEDAARVAEAATAVLESREHDTNEDT